MTAISKSKDEERILVDCRYGIADNCYINEILILLGDNMAVKNKPKLVIFGDPTKGRVRSIFCRRPTSPLSSAATAALPRRRDI
jgi:hypothetical protein